MTVKGVLINVTDVARSVGFYVTVLDAVVVSQSESGAILDLDSGTIELNQVTAPADWSTWRDDSQQAGFRHVGFKVQAVTPVVEKARAAGAIIRLEPLDAFGDVRVGFFFDPDGTLLEVVEKDLMYTGIHDAETVAFERSLDLPSRPRLDHVATTTCDLDAAIERWQYRGLRYMGVLAQDDHPRGFALHYLRDEGIVIELMTFTKVGVYDRQPQVGVPGFGAVLLDTEPPSGSASLGTNPRGRQVWADRDRLPVIGL